MSALTQRDCRQRVSGPLTSYRYTCCILSHLRSLGCCQCPFPCTEDSQHISSRHKPRKLPCLKSSIISARTIQTLPYSFGLFNAKCTFCGHEVAPRIFGARVGKLLKHENRLPSGRGTRHIAFPRKYFRLHLCHRIAPLRNFLSPATQY
jgi:hypothetical protein